MGEPPRCPTALPPPRTGDLAFGDRETLGLDLRAEEEGEARPVPGESTREKCLAAAWLGEVEECALTSEVAVP
jgi:hypothetical protein